MSSSGEDRLYTELLITTCTENRIGKGQITEIKSSAPGD